MFFLNYNHSPLTAANIYVYVDQQATKYVLMNLKIISVKS